MTRILSLFLLVFTFLSQPGPATADDSKELRKQRQDAQRLRQQQVTERTKEINGSIRAFRDYSRDLKTDYREQVKDLDTEFELRRVELKADHEVRVAGAEAEYQKKFAESFYESGGRVHG